MLDDWTALEGEAADPRSTTILSVPARTTPARRAGDAGGRYADQKCGFLLDLLADLL